MTVPTGHGRAALIGRQAERAALESRIASARAGAAQVVVLRGEAGIGKTTLLEYAASADGFQVLRADGVESEMELAYATLHQLCGPVLDRVSSLPGPQRDALDVVFGTTAGPAPERFLVGLAVLSLFSVVADEGPLLCVVDDLQWADRASSQVLGFMARRLAAEPVMIAFGTRERLDELRGLTELEVRGLHEPDALALLGSVLPFAVDDDTRDRILAEARGNPLALLEFPLATGFTDRARASGASRRSLSGQLKAGYSARIAALPEAARSVLLIAAADPARDPGLVQRAAGQLGVSMSAVTVDAVEDLLTISDRVTFRHPLIRATVYEAATPDQRRAVHLALAEVTDGAHEPDRRAWHLASAAVAPDEAVAEELERSAGRAQARGGLVAAAAFLQRAAALTESAPLRSDRALAASQVNLHAGAFETALRMLAVAESGELDELRHARAALLRAQVAFASGHGGDAPRMLLMAAARIQAVDPEAAREALLEAWGAALFAGEATSGDTMIDAARAAQALPRSDAARPSDLLLDGLATLTTAGLRAAAPKLRRATAAFSSPNTPVEDNFRWGWLTTVPSNVLWDENAWDTINVRQLGLAREAGALARLPIDLTAMGILRAWRGDFDAADAAATEAETIVAMTATSIAPFAGLFLAALRGREDESTALSRSAAEAAAGTGQGVALQYASWTTAILFNGLSRYQRAFEAARQATAEAPHLFLSAWALPELVESGVMVGDGVTAVKALGRLEETAAAAGTDWALGVTARSRGLLDEGPSADDHFHEAIERLGRTNLRPEVARSHLAYGEWLRRRGRRVEAREQLRTAHELFVAIGMEAFATRARRELLAAGGPARGRANPSSSTAALTAQELQIARLVRSGLSNPEVGARLFLSPRTVEWHLRKIFDKLAVNSRRELRDVLPRDASPPN